jgi:deoxyribose-phosphate aldolase
VTDPHLVEAIVRAVLGQLAPVESACACHAVDGCPDRLAHAMGHGAERLGLRAGATAYPREIARAIDHTLLKPDATRGQIETLCAEAREHGFATVCVNPTWVPLCAALLRGSDTGVCTVVGFPLGATFPEVKALEAARAVEAGAAEIDMVLNVGALRSGLHRLVHDDVAAVVEASHARRAIVKVILETALLTDDEKVKGAVLAQTAGADFVKTSTGFGPGGATVADVALLRRVVGPGMGVKAAGGVRDLRSAQEMIQAGADRIGASVGVKIVRESRGETGSAPAPPPVPGTY